MKYIQSNGLKLICLSLSFMLFAMSHKSFASGEKQENNIKNTKSKLLEKQNFTLVNSDSLKSAQKRLIQKKDSISSSEKSSTSSGASYNILFQVIYRNSFSEIFEEKK